MFTGKGVLVSENGSRLAVTYEYIETARNGWAGRIFCDLSGTDRPIFAENMLLECENLLVMLVNVTEISLRMLVFVGRETAASSTSLARRSSGSRRAPTKEKPT